MGIPFHSSSLRAKKLRYCVFMTDDRKWHLAWAKLEAFKNALPSPVVGSHVQEYHEILVLLEESSGEDLTSFRIEEDQLKPEVIAFKMPRMRRAGGAVLGDRLICDRNLMSRQIASLVIYLGRLYPPTKRGYGFEQ